MKYYISVITVFLLTVLLLTACQDSLNTDPLAEVTTDNFFQTASDLELYTNSFYLMFPEASIYNGDADNIMETSLSARIRGDRVVPTDAGSAGWTWDDLRKINYFLAHYQKANDDAAKRHYSGVARFFRAYFYFNKVKRFGDVPWYSEPVDPDDEQALQKARDPRGMVVDSVLNDLDYAVNNMSETPRVYQATKWTALALRSRVGLFEGTFRKYHGLDGAEKYLNIAWQAAGELMESGNYVVYSTGEPDSDYRDLFASHDAVADEIILARQFNSAEQIDHNVNYYTITSSYGRPGMPKDLVNSYLMNDGSRFTDKDGYRQKQFTEEVQNRDPRLKQTIRTPGYHRMGETQTIPPNFGATVTGYQITKFVTEPEYDSYDASIADLPLFRYAEVLLNYAEARAELGILTQADLDRSVNLLRDRVAMPDLSLGQANASPDPFLEKQYQSIGQSPNKGIILEIRRERRIELFMENFRWDDLMRWKEGQKLTQPFRGMYFPGTGEYDLEDDGDMDLVIYSGSIDNKQEGIVYLRLGEDVVLDDRGLVIPQPGSNEQRTFDESKDYLYPLPRTELLLNSSLDQNPGW
ncbi:Starch-binding associating with outer membrane [Fodinibius roseus]|uniref:Starch-binding associating with outer membrane n=1 Tax=Fodinibius roseus TaxID=1194090 RepID=A0A1M4W8X0_9BACT|nr:RagB/SusD family nutrient uptake outer membrane protein [Fodinibius roseus]SHE77605.1 Starch-binding associating with outer membrane [Fodinibius roseus]